MTIQFIEVGNLELDAVAELAFCIWHEHYDPIIGAEQVDYMLERFQSASAVGDQIAAGTRYKLALLDGSPIGYYAAKEEPDHIFLSKAYLLKEQRGKGFFRLIVQDLKREFPGAKSVCLTVNKGNTNSVAAYRALGFAVVDAIKTDIGNGYFMDDYVMRLDR